jgi:hypothetical protein
MLSSYTVNQNALRGGVGNDRCSCERASKLHSPKMCLLLVTLGLGWLFQICTYTCLHRGTLRNQRTLWLFSKGIQVMSSHTARHQPEKVVARVVPA